MASHGPVEPYIIGDARYETRDVKYRSMFVYIGGMFVFLFVASFTAWLVYRLFVPWRGDLGMGTPLTSERRLPPDPKLQAFPKTEMKVFRQEEDVKIGQYRWADKKTNTVKIPIEAALSAVAKEGLPKEAVQPIENPTKPNEESVRAQKVAPIVKPTPNTFPSTPQ